VKWHFKTKQGIKNFTRESADEMRGQDPDFAQRDLFNAIKEGNFPKWRVSVQIMPEKQAEVLSPQSLRSHQGLAHKTIRSSKPANSFSTAIPKIISPKSSKPLRTAQRCSRHGFLARQKCCKRV